MSNAALQHNLAIQEIRAPRPVRFDARIVPDSSHHLFAKPIPKWKRALDVIGASAVLIAALPVMLAVAVAIKFSSRGPILFAQKRGGLGGKPFDLYKFRSMSVDAEARKAELMKFNERSGPVFKMTHDPRVTAIGRFIRKTSLDELPQLFNVLKGDMSLVGPRPLPKSEEKGYDHWHWRRLDVKPGLTCIWQVTCRHDKDFDRWVRLDLEYIENYSLLLDLKLLIQTIPAVLAQRGAC